MPSRDDMEAYYRQMPSKRMYMPLIFTDWILLVVLSLTPRQMVIHAAAKNMRRYVLDLLKNKRKDCLVRIS